MAPPRRRAGDGGSVNAAALKAARQRNRGCGEGSDDDDDDLPRLVDDTNSNAEQKQQLQEIENDGDSDDENLRCLHCQAESTDIQVRCDECSAYICEACHWCHEFQANHEIRVCDRCDAFYCRGCDEMDQCDDCAEVVCASCSTLLSCKFCGGGLCEECATACGRCGIVLCSRDAKFAVDCDTCRLSYCLVCLASGSKDPCVRCGTRPSKRMEQLVHLRLKSIYKAFKQNSSSTAKSPNTRERQNDDPDEDHMADDPEALFQAAASAAKNSPQKNRSRSKHHKRSESAGSSSTLDRVNRFKEEKEKADAAAAALLAELEEEEEAEKSKMKKKKKKKAKQQAKKEDDPKNDDDLKIDSDVRREEDADDVSSIEDADNSREGTSRLDAKPSAKPSKEKAALSETKVVTPEAEPLEKELCVLVAMEDVEGLENLMESIKGIPGRAVLRKNAKKALKRLRLANCPPEDDDEEEFLDAQPEVMDDVQKSSTLSNTRVTTPVTQPPSDPSGLLRIVSHTHNKQASQCAMPGSHHGPNLPRARGPTTGALKSECVMHMAPGIVGWVIGKGGQRIRDLMEESGARIWIDQDSMGQQDPRIVYVSGHRRSVDSAVEMIMDLVSKAPTITSPQSRQATPSDPSGTTLKASAIGQAPTMPDSVDVVEVPLKPKVGLSFLSEPLRSSSRSSGVTDGRSRHVMTCDPRFVPLLIGRRGWTIKNIQDTTGAKVDIDQSVNPRKITISGSDENVEKAIRMVRDVLSYPHAQLQGGTEDNAQKDATVQDSADMSPHDRVSEVQCPTPTQEQVSNASLLSSTHQKTPGPYVEQSPLSPANEGRVRLHSPPSSLIMTGDARGTISASSSLSSTPEPVLPSSSRSHFAQVAPGPMMSPPQSRDIFSTGMNELPRNAFHQMPPPSPMAGPPVYQPQNGSGFFGTRDQGFGSMQPPGQGNLQQDRPTFLPANPSAFGPLPNESSMHHPIAFQPSPNGFHVIGGPGDPQSAMMNTFDNPGNGHIDVGPALWNGRDTPHGPVQVSRTQVSHRSDGFRLDAAVEFLEHSKHHSNAIPGVVGGINEMMGLSNPLGLQRAVNGQDPVIGFQKGRDDAQMVDSLFGPATSGNGTSLLTGLQELSLNGEVASTGLWGTSNTPDSSGLKGLPSLRALGPGPEDPLLFAGIEPTLSATERKSQSRFGWG